MIEVGESRLDALAPQGRLTHDYECEVDTRSAMHPCDCQTSQTEVTLLVRSQSPHFNRMCGCSLLSLNIYLAILP